jgi:hypothetical protein
MPKNDHNIGAQEEDHFAQIAENISHNIDPWEKRIVENGGGGGGEALGVAEVEADLTKLAHSAWYSGGIVSAYGVTGREIESRQCGIFLY